MGSWKDVGDGTGRQAGGLEGNQRGGGIERFRWRQVTG